MDVVVTRRFQETRLFISSVLPREYIAIWGYASWDMPSSTWATEFLVLLFDLEELSSLTPEPKTPTAET